MTTGIVLLSSTDAKRMAALHKLSFGHASTWSEKSFTELVSASTTLATGIEGTFGLSALLIIQKTDPDCEILTFCVAPTARRAGLGRTLLQSTSKLLAQSGIMHMHLDVACDNMPARRLYRSLGFTQDGQRKGYYRRADQQPVDAILMSRTTNWTDADGAGM